MPEVMKSLLELIDAQPSVNNEDTFERLWGLMGGLRQKVNARFNPEPHPATKKFAAYHSLDGNASGSLNGFTAKEIEWMIHSRIGNPKYSFSNAHLTVWLKPHTNAPHWGMAMGTIPDVFVYIDFIPRVDLWTDLNYLDRYYEPLNEIFIKVRSHPLLSPFISKTLYMRQAQSQTSLCFTCKPSEEAFALIEQTAHDLMDRWLTCVDQGEAVPAAQQQTLRERDRLIRRAIAERDPANPMGVRLFGEQMTDELVKGLWGGLS